MKCRGTLSADLATYLALSLAVVITLAPLAYKMVNHTLTSARIHAYVDEIVFRSRDHYALSVLRTRCLAQSDLSMSALGMASDLQAGVSYHVAYQQSHTAHDRPLGIAVTVTLNDAKLQNQAAWLSADEVRNHTLTFYRPLNYQLPDWQQLNTNTGCIK